jgi:hypothetical protein
MSVISSVFRRLGLHRIGYGLSHVLIVVIGPIRTLATPSADELLKWVIGKLLYDYGDPLSDERLG